jgi:hypothetical protein
LHRTAPRRPEVHQHRHFGGALNTSVSGSFLVDVNSPLIHIRPALSLKRFERLERFEHDYLAISSGKVTHAGCHWAHGVNHGLSDFIFRRAELARPAEMELAPCSYNRQIDGEQINCAAFGSS